MEDWGQGRLWGGERFSEDDFEDPSDSLVVCEVDPELKEKLRKFRFRKETDNAAIIMKVDKDRQMVVLEEEFQVFEIRTTDDLTEAWLQEKLSFFR
ncbi:Glia maturation factor gamma [Pteropus alecto]|uniref:Glia maturation factor gamma n=1 Tax=Pteropus alecto TaxID=9402 RepID=L5L4J7_PTEAL|nr:Glia maturation factor gamma [Pteropus alecto]